MKEDIFQILLFLHYPNEFDSNFASYKEQYKKYAFVGIGKVLVFGNNKNGQLGIEDFDGNINSPTEIELPFKLKKVSCGNYVTYFLDEDGKVWGCGDNQSCQLGEGNGMIREKIMRIPIPVKITEVAGGTSYSIFLDEERKVWGCGNSHFGQFGMDIVGRLLRNPTKLDVNIKIRKVFCGAHHTIFLDEDGKVWGCGNNQNCQLGRRKIYRDFICTSILIPNMKVTNVSCGLHHTIFLDEDGKVWICGGNRDGKLGLGEDVINQEKPIILEFPVKIINIACAVSHSMFLDENGKVWVCGSNYAHRIGLGKDVFHRETPIILKLPVKIIDIACNNLCSFFLDEDGKVWVCGTIGLPCKPPKTNVKYEVPTQLDTNVRIKRISCGENHATFTY